MVDLDGIEARREVRKPNYGRTQVCITEDDFDAMVRELRTLRARVAEMERDAIPCPACGDLGHKMSCHVRSREAIDRYIDELKRDARLGAVVREAVGDDVGLLHSMALWQRAPVRDRVVDAVADALRAEEGDHDE